MGSGPRNGGRLRGVSRDGAIEPCQYRTHPKKEKISFSYCYCLIIPLGTPSSSFADHSPNYVLRQSPWIILKSTESHTKRPLVHTTVPWVTVRPSEQGRVDSNYTFRVVTSIIIPHRPTHHLCRVNMFPLILKVTLFSSSLGSTDGAEVPGLRPLFPGASPASGVASPVPDWQCPSPTDLGRSASSPLGKQKEGFR